MRIKLICLVALVALMSANVSHAALVGSFRLVDAGKTTNNLVYNGLFDTWAFDVENVGLGVVEAFELDFHGAFLQTSGNTSVQQTAVNPLVFGFEAPETFFVTRSTILPADVLVAPGTLVDTATDFKVSYTVAGAPSLLDTGEKRPIAFFSVAGGAAMPDSVFVSGKAAIAGVLTDIGLGGGGDNLPPDVTDAIQNVTLDMVAPITLTNFAFQLLATDDGQPTPGLAWALQSFTGPGTPTAAPALSAGGNFTWTPDGSKGGQYIATVRATDNGGLFADGTLTINLTVPEPTTLSLLGLALVGCVGFARRR